MKRIVEDIVDELRRNPYWDGLSCIVEMRDSGGSQWRQMEWAGFYFEFVVARLFAGSPDVLMPGVSRFANTLFDVESSVFGVADLKVHTVGSGPPLLNDVRAVDEVIARYGEVYFLVLNVDMLWDDDSRSFARAVDVLKGKPSRYVLEGRSSGRRHRRRKCAATLKSFDVFMFDDSDIGDLRVASQGRNSNGRGRPEKYALTSDSQPLWSYAIRSGLTDNIL